MNRLTSALARIGLGLMIVCVTLVSSGSSANATEEKYVQLSAGSAHTCGVSVTGSVRCWGYNNYGQLGLGYTSEDVSSPTLVPGLDNVASVTAKGRHTCALLKSGLVKCWGYNDYGQLGLGYMSYVVPSPTLVSGLTGVASVIAGSYHTCGILVTGAVKCWGHNHQGQLGLGYTGSPIDVPTLVPGLSDVRAIVAGEFHTCAVLISGAIKCWGYNNYGQLGLGYSGAPVSSPTLLRGLSDVRAIVAGGYHTCTVLISGAVKCWGYNMYGQLGLGNNSNSESVASPALVPDLDDIGSINAGLYHTCAALMSGAVKCWGSNGNRQLGLGPEIQSEPFSSPTVILKLPLTENLVIGDYHSCALMVAGEVRCWGENSGQLGLGYTSDPVSSPTLVPGVVLAHTPAAPNISSIVPSAGALTFKGTAPNNGGSKITDYQYTLDGGITWFTANPRVTSSPYKLTGLANGTTYRVQVRAVNGVGVGAATAVVVVSMPRG